MDGIKNFGLTALIGGAVVTVFSIIGARKRNESFRNNILEFVGSKTKTSMDQQQNDANKGFLVLMCISAGADLILLVRRLHSFPQTESYTWISTKKLFEGE